MAWIEQALSEFGIAGLSLHSLIEFLKGVLKNTNAAVRTSAIKTLVMVKIFAGPSISNLLCNLNPQLLATIQSEFEKVDGNVPPEPVRQLADDLTMVLQGSTGKSGAAASAALDDLFPRVEIDGLLKGTTILADAKSDAWKTKKEALGTLQAILDQGANKRLKFQMGASILLSPSLQADTFLPRQYRTGPEGMHYRHEQSSTITCTRYRHSDSNQNGKTLQEADTLFRTSSLHRAHRPESPNPHHGYPDADGYCRGLRRFGCPHPRINGCA